MNNKSLQYNPITQTHLRTFGDQINPCCCASQYPLWDLRNQALGFRLLSTAWRWELKWHAITVKIRTINTTNRHPKTTKTRYINNQIFAIQPNYPNSPGNLLGSDNFLLLRFTIATSGFEKSSIGVSATIDCVEVETIAPENFRGSNKPLLVHFTTGIRNIISTTSRDLKTHKTQDINNQFFLW